MMQSSSNDYRAFLLYFAQLVSERKDYRLFLLPLMARTHSRWSSTWIGLEAIGSYLDCLALLQARQVFALP